MKKRLTIFLSLCLTATYAILAQEPVVVIDEDFSGFTRGTEDEPAPETLPIGALLGPPYVHAEGWRVNGVHQAGGCAALMEWSYYDSPMDGTIQTPEMALYGTATITLRARSLTDENTQLWISLCDNEYYGPVDEKIFDLTNQWQECTFSSERAEFNDRAIFQIQGWGSVLVDDVKVARTIDKIGTPEANPVANISTSEFIASWSKVPDAANYLLNVYSLEMPDRPYVEGEIFQDFDSDYSDWTFQGTQPADNGANSNGGASVAMSKYSDVILSPVSPEAINSISFWVKPSTTLPEETMSLLGVFFLKNGTWDHAANLPAAWLPTGGYYTFDAEQIGRDCTQVMFTIEQKGQVTFYIDDVTLGYATGKEPVPFVDNLAIEENSYTVSGIDPEKDYYYYVQSQQGSLLSKPSYHILVDGIAGLPVEAQEATGMETDRFTANWTALPHADNYTIAIDQFTTAHQALQDVVVIHEDFNMITEGTLANPGNYWATIDLSERGFANTQWQATQPIWCNGMIGSSGTSFFGLAGIVVTPRLSLDNNGGAFDVDATVYTQVPGETIFLLVIKDIYDTQSLAFQAITYPEGETGYLSQRVHFDEGGDKDILIAFMSMSGQAFYVDEATIYQDLQVGESLSRPLAAYKTDQNYYDVAIPSDKDNYQYAVRAKRTKNYEDYQSLWSESILVKYDNDAVSDIAIENKAKISVISRSNAIDIIADRDCQVAIYDINGICLHRLDIAAGCTTVPLHKGCYVVATDHSPAVKALVR